MYIISGSSYNIRDVLKNNGGKFDPVTKSWTISDETYAKLAARGHSWGVTWVRGWASVTKTHRPDGQPAPQMSDAYYNFVNEGGEGYRA